MKKSYIVNISYLNNNLNFKNYNNNNNNNNNNNDNNFILLES